MLLRPWMRHFTTETRRTRRQFTAVLAKAHRRDDNFKGGWRRVARDLWYKPHPAQPVSAGKNQDRIRQEVGLAAHAAGLYGHRVASLWLLHWPLTRARTRFAGAGRPVPNRLRC